MYTYIYILYQLCYLKYNDILIYVYLNYNNIVQILIILFGK